MPFTGTSAQMGTARTSSAHASREVTGTAVGAGVSTVLGPVRSIGMQRVVLRVTQTAGPVVGTVTLEYRVGVTWHTLVAATPLILNQPVVIDEILPGARQVRATITAPLANAASFTATLAVLQTP